MARVAAQGMMVACGCSGGYYHYWLPNDVDRSTIRHVGAFPRRSFTTRGNSMANGTRFSSGNAVTPASGSSCTSSSGIVESHEAETGQAFSTLA